MRSDGCSVRWWCPATIRRPNLAETSIAGSRPRSAGLGLDYELLFVDEVRPTGRSRPQAPGGRGPHVRYVALSRNFGQEAALLAGIDRADGDCVILMDDDLQDPPELITALIAKWREGYEEVHAVRRRRLGVGRSNRAFAFLFYRLVNRLSDTRIPWTPGTSGCSTGRRCWRCGSAASGAGSRAVSSRGWGFGRGAWSTTARGGSRGGASTPLRALLRLVLDAACGFSVKPLRLASLLGLLVTIVTFVLASHNHRAEGLLPPDPAGLCPARGGAVLSRRNADAPPRHHRRVSRPRVPPGPTPAIVLHQRRYDGRHAGGFGVRGSGFGERSREPRMARMDADRERESEISDSESEIPQSAIRNPQSAIPEPRTPNPEPLCRNPQSAIRNPQSPSVQWWCRATTRRANLRELHRRLTAVLTGLFTNYEIILVDDGSRDGTPALMKALAAEDGRVRYVTFSRNFGHEVASTAGLDRARANASSCWTLISRDPPELIPDLVAKWREGYQEVHTTRRRRAGPGPVPPHLHPNVLPRSSGRSPR